jgi:hypothetical protein
MLWDAAMLSSFAQEIKLEQAPNALASTTSKYVDQNTSIRGFFYAALHCRSPLELRIVESDVDRIQERSEIRVLSHSPRRAVSPKR